MAEYSNNTDPNISKSGLRMAFEDLIANGADTQVLKEYRQTLAERLGVSRGTIGSVAAYVRYSATVALDETNLAGEVSRDELVEAARYIRLYPGERQDAIDGYAAFYGVDGNKLSRAIDAYYARIDEKPEGNISARSISPDLSNAVDSSDTLAPSRLLIHNGNIHEWQIDYDNELKERWRLQWRTFIERTLSPEQLHDARVLCMPSINAELEVRHYLSLGIQAKNIYAVDHATGDDRTKFIEACTKLGVNPLCGDLTDAACSIEEVAILNIDSHGPYSTGIHLALQNARLTENAVVIVNCLARREQEFSKRALALSAIKGSERYIDFVRGDTVFVPDHVTDFESMYPEIAEARSSGLAMAVWRAVAIHERQPFWPEAIDYLRSQNIFDDTQKRVEAMNELVQMAKLIESAWSKLPRSIATNFKLCVHEYAISGMIADKVCQELEKWRYVSQSGSGGSPFESAFIRLRNSNQSSAMGRHELRTFIWSAMKDIHRYYKQTEHLPECSFTRTDSKQCLLSDNQLWSPKDVLRFRVDGKTATSIEVKRLFKGMEEWKTRQNEERKNKRLFFRDVKNCPIQVLT